METSGRGAGIMKRRRIRDPLHDLIEFGDNDVERILWKVVESRPFQRLRRVKQLGFSELVYPGASHSRFAHSIGVFHMARHLMKIVKTGETISMPEEVAHALTAALVHDLGHGPFSHSFESVGKRLGLKYAQHEEMSDYLVREGEVGELLNEEFGHSDAAQKIADILKKDGVKTVHHAVVSSQFDADRLDYMRRDRLMTGTQHAAIDLTWLVANLEVAPVSVGVDDDSAGSIHTFVIGPKAVRAAEAYILGLFHLYPTVYMHKSTRGAEKLFEELIVKIVGLVRDDSQRKTGLPANHPLIKFAKNPDDPDLALSLDDSIVTGAFPLLANSQDSELAELATRLKDRVLYKCQDFRRKVAAEFDPGSSGSDDLDRRIDTCCEAIERRILSWKRRRKDRALRILVDKDSRSPYKHVNESRGPLGRINVRTDGDKLVDLGERSALVASLKSFKLHRAYASRDDREATDFIKRVISEEIEKCRAA